jgi:hypothetical protein
MSLGSPATWMSTPEYKKPWLTKPTNGLTTKQLSG